MRKRPINFYIDSLEKIEEDYFILEKSLPKIIDNTNYFLEQKYLDILELKINYYNTLIQSDNQLREYFKLSKQKTGNLNENETFYWKKDMTNISEDIRKTRDTLRENLKSLTLENHLYSALLIIEYHNPRKP